MIAGIFHQGSGLGNQLFRYVATRVLAKDKGYEFGMVEKERFKGKDFMALDMGKDVPCSTTVEFPSGKVIVDSPLARFEERKIVENGVDVRSYDPEINFVEDNTIIDGEFQDDKYFSHRLDVVREWFKVEPLDMPDDLCVIGFRGGEFAIYPDLFLTDEYWEGAIAHKLSQNKNMRFEVHTDDPAIAKQFFPGLPIIHDVAFNWRSVRYAKHLIIANSSFYILPALLNEDVREVIAPRYWARRNIGKWAMSSNYYKEFKYL